jgi:ribosomal protein S18 acetylase RimI-like enzyme
MSDYDKPAFTLRVATHEDVDAIVALVHSAYRGDRSRAGWTTEADLIDGQRTDAEEVGDLIGAPDSRMLLCTRGGADLLASAHVCRQAETSHFGMFAVRPEAQRQGIGSTLLAEAEILARDEWNCRYMQMSVISLRSELIAWYERRGYRRTGRFKPFPYGEARYGQPRRNDLQMELLRKPLR